MNGRKWLYLCENKRELDIHLHCNHGEEIYRGFCDDRADHSRKFERAHIVVRVPNNDEECGKF